MRRTLIAVLLALSAQALFGQGAEEATAPAAPGSVGAGSASAAAAGSGPAGSLAVMPYYAPPGALPPDYAFSLFTVVDVIRLTLLEEGRFALFEKSELQEAALAAGYAEGWAEDEVRCLGVARGLGADYLIRGYAAWTGDRLKVVHLLLDAASGRTLHIAERELGTGPALVRDIEDSAREFSLRAGRALPDREPERVVIETERIVQAARPARSIEGGASLAFPLWRIEQYLAQSPGLRLGFYSEARPASRIALGARAELYLLNQRQAFFVESGQRIDVLFIPVYAEGRWAALRSRLVALELSIAAGPAVVFGLVSPELISYFRPSAAIGADAVLFPGSPFSLVVGCGASWTFDVYEDLQLTSFAPRLALRFTR